MGNKMCCVQAEEDNSARLDGWVIRERRYSCRDFKKDCSFGLKSWLCCYPCQTYVMKKRYFNGQHFPLDRRDNVKDLDCLFKLIEISATETEIRQDKTLDLLRRYVSKMSVLLLNHPRKWVVRGYQFYGPPLHFVFWVRHNNKREISKMMISRGARSTSEWFCMAYSPFQYACLDGDKEMIRHCLQNGLSVKDCGPLLHWAISNMLLSAVDELLSFGVDAQVKNSEHMTPLETACGNYLKNCNDGCEKLSNEELDSNRRIMNSLFRHCADLDSSTGTPSEIYSNCMFLCLDLVGEGPCCIDHIECLDVLMSANGNHTNDLSDQYWRLVHSNVSISTEVSRHLDDVIHTPSSLLQICRATIRRTLQPTPLPATFEKLFEQYPLPVCMQRYLLFER